MNVKIFLSWAEVLLCLTHGALATLGYFFFLPPYIPLWYSLARPEDQLAQKIFVFIFPALCVGFMMLRRALTPPLKHSETALHILQFGTLFSMVFLTIAFIRMIILIT